MAQLFESIDKEFKGTLNEGVLGRLVKGGLVGVASLIGKGLKYGISKGVSSKRRNKLEQHAESIKTNLINEIEKRVTSFKQDISDDTDQKTKAAKLKSFERDLTSFVKKKLSTESKRIENSIDKLKRVSEDDKLNIRYYWENLSAMLELDIMENLRKQDIVDRDTVKEYARNKESELKSMIELIRDIIEGTKTSFSGDEKEDLVEELSNDIELYLKKSEKSAIKVLGKEAYNRYVTAVKEISRIIINDLSSNRLSIKEHKDLLRAINRGGLSMKTVENLLNKYKDSLEKVGKPQFDIDKLKDYVVNHFNWLRDFLKQDLNVRDKYNTLLYGPQGQKYLQNSINKVLDVDKEDLSSEQKIQLINEAKHLIRFIIKAAKQLNQKPEFLEELKNKIGDENWRKLVTSETNESEKAKLKFEPIKKYIK